MYIYIYYCTSYISYNPLNTVGTLPGRCRDTARTMVGHCQNDAETLPRRCRDTARTVEEGSEL